MSFQIQFRESHSLFRPASRPGGEDWIDTSFSQSPRAVGDLRLPAVDNGRYPEKHPVFDPKGQTVGFLLDGANSLGYTFACVYAGDCFWIAHQGFGATLNSGGSEVSLVDATGSFMLSRRGAKFRVVKSFSFGGGWSNSIRAFKVLDNGNSLLYLTDHGVCLFDTREREIVRTVAFTNIAFQWSGFALSPKVKLLAIICSARADKDRLDGEYRFANFVRIYDLEAGSVVGEQALPGDRQTRWTTDFSDDGRQIRAASGSSVYIFDLSVV